MSIRLSGAQWDAFYADPQVWPQKTTERGLEHTRWYDDAVITVDGENIDDLPEGYVMPPHAEVIVQGGVYYHSHETNAKTESFEKVVRRWLRDQQHDTVVVQVPKAQLEAFIAALPTFSAKRL